jgi:NAD+ diphosphatase
LTPDHRARSARNTFAGSPIDRVHSRRQDDDWVAERLSDPTTRFTFLWRSRNLVTAGDSPRAATLPPPGLEPFLRQAVSVMLLGLADGSACFAVDLPPDREPPDIVSAAGVFRDLREFAPLLAPAEAGLLAQARGLAYWHRRHRFCGSCGSPARSAEAGHVRLCTNEACGEHHFPRTDPAIIVLVTSGDRCLLGRQAAWPENRYSTIAGFVEPGESLEDAVAREVEEETGVVVGPVTYHSSQPWPFPASLMLGFTAEARDETIRLQDELEDARWFSRGELREALESGTVRLPTPLSISFRLIEHWFDLTGRDRLEALPRAAW